ncbi:MAG: xylulokinase [Chloroflexi bacterium]|nr:xylulokinase [Chloroflexota bacterium]
MDRRGRSGVVGPLVAGVDSSTQSTTVVIVDASTGARVASGRASHVVTGTDGARETDPETWWAALAEALAATGHARDITAISVGAQQHGLVVLDGSGRPLRPAVLWNDTRSGPQTERLIETLGRETWATRIGTVPVPSITITRWMWLRDTEPALAQATRAIRLPHDFLTERLCGRGVTDRGDASGTGWWSTATGAYDEGVLALPGVELDVSMLPEVLGPAEVAGRVTPAAAEALGIPAGIPVGPGSGDNAAAALGLGLRPGTPIVSLGTSGVATAVSERRAVDPSGIIAGFADATGRYLPLTATLNCTLAVDRVAAWLGLDRDAVAPSDGVVVLPWFDGERTPSLPDAEAVFLGLRHTTGPGAILAAAYEGAVLGLLDALDAIGACADPLDPDAPVVLVGGGARGGTWQETVRRLSGRAVRVPADPDLVARGAAVQAAAVLAGVGPMEVHQGWPEPEGTTLEPMPVDQPVLDRMRGVRASVQSAVSELRRSRPAG